MPLQTGGWHYSGTVPLNVPLPRHSEHPVVFAFVLQLGIAGWQIQLSSNQLNSGQLGSEQELGVPFTNIPSPLQLLHPSKSALVTQLAIPG